MDIEEAGNSSTLLMDLAVNEESVHGNFFNFLMILKISMMMMIWTKTQMHSWFFVLDIIFTERKQQNCEMKTDSFMEQCM